MKVPFVDLKSQYQAIKNEIDQAMQAVINDTAFIDGPYLEAFEEAFAQFCGTEYAVGVSSGTSALGLALKASGIGRGDEVITVPNTFMATVEAIIDCGARPVFVDIDPATCTLDVTELGAAITPSTRAIIPVHLYGQPVDMDPVMALAEQHNLLVIEDACQAHGATYKGRATGSLGHAGCFSFYPGKNLGAYGDGGAVVTNDQALAAEIVMLRNHGTKQKYVHEVVGWNERLDALQAAILQVKLKYLPEWNELRRAHAAAYNARLSEVPGITCPHEADYARHVYHVYGIHVQDRDAVMDTLKAHGAGCGIHYPIPVHLQQACGYLGHERGDFPHTEYSADHIVSLPMFPELSNEQIAYVVDTLSNAVGAAERGS
jgi:dTDP-4-amino-4,6-dideoxygalactose transaminase